MEKEYHRLLSCSKFWSELCAWDEESGLKCQAAGCPFCGGRLDRAYYERKPRGVLFVIDRLERRRVSFCCRDCRRRSVPESVRFARHKVFCLPAIILTLILTSQRAPLTTRRAGCLCGASEVTVRRWRSWVTLFLGSPRWGLLRARLRASWDATHFPSSLFLELQGAAPPPSHALFRTVRFLSVLSVRLIA